MTDSLEKLVHQESNLSQAPMDDSLPLLTWGSSSEGKDKLNDCIHFLHVFPEFGTLSFKIVT